MVTKVVTKMKFGDQKPVLVIKMVIKMVTKMVTNIRIGDQNRKTRPSLVTKLVAKVFLLPTK